MIDVVTLDIESYWSPTYSLSKLSPLEYVMGDEWELQFGTLKINDKPTYCFVGDAEVKYAYKQVPWHKVAVCGHNMSAFDAYVLAYRLGINPRMWMCSLAMARPIFGKTVGLSLAKLVKHFGLGEKDNRVLIQTRGRRLADFTAQEVADMKRYNKDDTDQARGVFKHLLPYYKIGELWQIDALTRMRTEPAFQLNVPLLETAASIERDRKYKALLDLASKLEIPMTTEDEVAEHVRSELASAPKFQALLESLGVEVPMKEGKPAPDGTVRMIPALAKTDEAMTELLEHEDPLVSAAARGRLDVKSTLLETRIQKFLTAGSLAGGKLPVPIRYCGAETTGRDSGEEYNCQNMPAIRGPAKPSDALRNSLEAPEGYVVIVADQSGIEMRVNHFLWRVPFTMQVFQNKADADLYVANCARRFDIPPEEVVKAMRQAEKARQLGLGFGASAKTFQRMARTQSQLILTEQEALDAVNEWRADHDEIAGREGGWRQCANGIVRVARGEVAAIDPWGLVHTCAEGFALPSGRLIRYPDLRQLDDGEWPDGRPKKSWFYGNGRHKTRITGPKADENVVQALARDSIFDCAVDFYKKTFLRPALRVHDELVYVVPKAKAEGYLEQLQSILRTPPRWWPELVVWSEGDMAKSYGAAK
jgi:hypothetical protein